MTDNRQVLEEVFPDKDRCRVTFPPSTDIRCDRRDFHGTQGGRSTRHEVTLNGITVEWCVTRWPTIPEVAS